MARRNKGCEGGKKKMGRPPRVPLVRGLVLPLAAKPTCAPSKIRLEHHDGSTGDDDEDHSDPSEPPLAVKPALPVHVPALGPLALSSDRLVNADGQAFYQALEPLHAYQTSSWMGQPVVPPGPVGPTPGNPLELPQPYPSPITRPNSRMTKINIFTNPNNTIQAQALLSRDIVTKSCVADWFVGSQYEDPAGSLGCPQVTNISVELDGMKTYTFESISVEKLDNPFIALVISAQDIVDMTIWGHSFPCSNDAILPVPGFSNSVPVEYYPRHDLSSSEEDDPLVQQQAWDRGLSTYNHSIRSELQPGSQPDGWLGSNAYQAYTGTSQEEAELFTGVSDHQLPSFASAASDVNFQWPGYSQ